mmetsp:Transcript_9514/g.18454  ORF Transcript_9514/g.18454 Transcript_9514/m.18454 type:complete len:130 (+) Transcript_9514:453-842(+)|eukprot:CAMPEP_0173387390 /NCGR_PEP_ID=MMETSP1356-20130122/9901_1 /TAXON_ID=77927 ORGANISM="Hemiselmis virescens, Strain PCC157" /NCGR_SAMPLE_ID=MMETSP1356 /ASSEMBLY_ACC=CAM_ASM_000847 /LENGTH=129 /DNA_ID=CAMNT_0014343989 /DNA_START=226 /DNA_END=615 /DNA_ORIENTATION=-
MSLFLVAFPCMIAAEAVRCSTGVVDLRSDARDCDLDRYDDVLSERCVRHGKSDFGESDSEGGRLWAMWAALPSIVCTLELLMWYSSCVQTLVLSMALNEKLEQKYPHACLGESEGGRGVHEGAEPDTVG